MRRAPLGVLGHFVAAAFLAPESSLLAQPNDEDPSDWDLFTVGPDTEPDSPVEPGSGQGVAGDAKPDDPPAASLAEEARDVTVLALSIDEESGDVTQLDDIQVTASKRIKSQRDIPGSVGAIRGDTLEKLSAQSLKDYVKLVPGVAFIDRGTERSLPIIRGIATSVTFGATPATTGIYLEEMPFADLFRPTSIPDLNPFDLDRVEVLKGPQGTLFGSGSFAGAIRYLIQRPKQAVWETKLSATYSLSRFGSPSRVGAAAVNVPIGGTFALRGVGVIRSDGGLYDERSTDENGNTIRDAEDADRIDQSSARILADWDVTDELSISGFYFDQSTDIDGGLGLADNREELSIDGIPFPSPQEHQFGGANIEAAYDFDWGRMLSISNLLEKDNYATAHQEFAFGLGDQDEQEFLAIVGDVIDGYTQEFRLTSPDGGTGDWEWLVGGSVLHYENAHWEYTNFGPRQPAPRRPEQVTEQHKTSGFLFATIDQIGEETAFFGEITGRVGEHLEITLGARAYKTTLDADTVLCGAQIVLLFQQNCREDTYADQSDGINPKFSIRYQHDRNMQTYVLAARGFQFGGIQLNPPAPGFPETTEQAGFTFGPYKSSDLWNYELGLRTEWLDRRVRFDLAAFYMDWTDLQVTLAVPLPQSEIPAFLIIANVGAAHSEGIEAALDIVPFPGAVFTSSAAWISALTEEPFPVGDGTGTFLPPGTRLPGSPRFQWTNVLSATRSLPYFSSFTGGISFTHAHLGSAPNQIASTGTVGGYDTVDMRVTLAHPGADWFPNVSAGVNNLTDARGSAFNLNQVDATSTSGGRIDLNRFVTPRTGLVTLAWRF